MKTGHAAKALGVDSKTITNWINHPALNKFFSDSAAGRDGQTQRDITQDDLLLLNTVLSLRSRMPPNATDWNAIAAALDSGDRNSALPPSAATVETGMTDIDRWKYAIVLEQERNDAIARKVDAERRLEALEQRLSTIEADRRAEQATLLREVSDAERRADRAETELELWRAGRLKPE